MLLAPAQLARALRTAVLACATVHGNAAAQEVSYEFVRGEVTDNSKRPIVGAAVHVTRGPDRLVRSATTDSAGQYSVRFEPGTGDYLVAVTATGYRSARRRVQRQNGQRVLKADFTLAADATMLAAVRVKAHQPVRARNDVQPTEPETGSAESWKDGVDGSVSPVVAGDLRAVMATMPGITLGPGGPVILGLGPESNLTTLNGLGLATNALPRAAYIERRLTAATFDPTRGGFAGANIDVRLGPGSRVYQRRNIFITMDPPQLQATDPIGRAVGAATGGVRASAAADGELIRQALTYNVALEWGRSVSGPSTLITAEPEVLIRAGVAPDSVDRLIAAAQQFGLLSAKAIPKNQKRDVLTWLGRVDDTRDTLRERSLATYVTATSERGVGFGPLVTPTTGGKRRETVAGAQLVVGEYVGPSQNVLNETRIAATGLRTATHPYRELPGATVLIRSPSFTGQTSVAGIGLGGSSLLLGKESRWTIEAANETRWNVHGSRHRFRSSVWARSDGLTRDAVSNGLGSFDFVSISDFTANRPSSFTRVLSQPRRGGHAWNAAAALADQFVPSRYFSVIYGARVEAMGFGAASTPDPDLASALGVTTGKLRARWHLSPRFGFTWTYNRDRENSHGITANPVGRFYRTMVGSIRGGIGEFRSLLRPELAADASTVGGRTLLSCIGSATPLPDWSAYASDPSTIPDRCLDGGGALAERALGATLIDSRYEVPRSWRASLGWSSNLSKLLIQIGALGSYDLNQPGDVNVNFTGVRHFALDAGTEGGRPMYVPMTAVDPASGWVSAAPSRIASEWGDVEMRKTDLRGYGAQLTAMVAPDIVRFGASSASFFSSLSYTLQSSRRQYRGFDGGGFGDPRIREWAPSDNDVRHMIIGSGGFSTATSGTVTLFLRVQSGLPFSPLVQGDVDGDGRGDDRAFVPRAGEEADVELAAKLQALFVNGTDRARDCISAIRGRLPSRNSCRGPWTQSMNLQWRPPIPQKWTGRVTWSAYFENIPSGVDQLFHRGSRLRGWGSAVTPDPVLLIRRGFDSTAKRFRYDVNPRFADTRPTRTTLRTPFRLVLDVNVDLAVSYPLQQLRRALEPVRAIPPHKGWTRRSADSLAAFYLSRTSSIHKALLSESDSLFLTPSQMTALRRADSAFSARVREIYRQLGNYLDTRQSKNPGKAELDSASATDKTYWRIFWEQPEVADSIVTATQKFLMPTLVGLTSVPKSEREQSRWYFGYPVTLRDP